MIALFQHLTTLWMGLDGEEQLSLFEEDDSKSRRMAECLLVA